jgi:hypothetical protein
MAGKLSVGLSKKLGLPGFRSVGAHCDVELTIDVDRADGGAEAIKNLSAKLYAACRQVVEEELARHQEGPSADFATPNSTEVHSEPPSAAADGAVKRRATIKQVRALSAIAFDRGMDLRELLLERFAKDRPEDLGLGEASKLIEELTHPPFSKSRH